jgi:hypothetical protein
MSGPILDKHLNFLDRYSEKIEYQKVLNFTKIMTISYVKIDQLYYYNFYIPNSNKKYIFFKKIIVIPHVTIDKLY